MSLNSKDVAAAWIAWEDDEQINKNVRVFENKQNGEIQQDILNFMSSLTNPVGQFYYQKTMDIFEKLSQEAEVRAERAKYIAWTMANGLFKKATAAEGLVSGAGAPITDASDASTSGAIVPGAVASDSDMTTPPASTQRQPLTMAQLDITKNEYVMHIWGEFDDFYIMKCPLCGRGFENAGSAFAHLNQDDMAHRQALLDQGKGEVSHIAAALLCSVLVTDATDESANAHNMAIKAYYAGMRQPSTNGR